MSPRLVTLASVAALVVASLSGCVVVDTAPQDGTAAPHPTASPTGSSSRPSGSASTSSPTIAPKVDLSPAAGTTYLAAFKPMGMLSPPKVVGPWIEQWVIDGDKLTYREVICTGTALRTATGTLEEGDDGTVVRWIDNGDGEADDPWIGNAKTATTPLKFTDTELKAPLHEGAVSDVDGQVSAFVAHCKDAGETVVDFVKNQ